MYIVITEIVTGGHSRLIDTRVKEFATEATLQKYLSSGITGKVRVFEATELDYALELKLSNKETIK